MGSANPNRRPSVNAVGRHSGQRPTGRFALVIGASRVNNVVVSRIVQDCGIKPVASNATEAIGLLEDTSPILIVLEGKLDADGVSCLLEKLTSKQETGNAPPTIYLTSDGAREVTGYRFSAIAKMPVTVETLRPLIDRLASEHHRDRN